MAVKPAVKDFARQSRGHWLAILFVVVLAGACITYTNVKPAAEARGIRFVHEKHKDTECGLCHVLDGSGKAIPNHELCSTCHEIDMEKKDAQTCGKCHTRADYTFAPRTKTLNEEVKFAHDIHAKKEVTCDKCHPAPDKGLLPEKIKGTDGRMAFCMDCHGKTDPKLNDCAVCHTQMSKSTRPTRHGMTRIAHDAPQIWETTHGEMSRNDPKFCAMCHEDKTFCEDCHAKNPPKSHTVSWRRTGHGLRAEWDRAKCATCHEEDMCLKCHQKTEPANHRTGWAQPVNRHCVQCHFPVRDNNCTVCHESVEHRSAMPSPHSLGVFPARCILCHPAGLVHRAPHPENSTARCVACHH